MFSFAPASTRAAIERLPLLDRERLLTGHPCLPSYEVPGESDWHVDLLCLYAVETAGRAFLLPAAERTAYFDNERRTNPSLQQLSAIEVESVLALAAQSLRTAGDTAVIKTEWNRHLNLIANKKRELAVRLEEMQRRAKR